MFWGGLCTGIFSGWAADRYGPKLLLLIATVIHVIGSMISPIAAVHTGYIGLTIVRFIMGFGQVNLNIYRYDNMFCTGCVHTMYG